MGSLLLLAAAALLATPGAPPPGAAFAAPVAPPAALALPVVIDSVTHTLTLLTPRESVRQAVTRFARSNGRGLSATDLLVIERAAHLQIASHLAATLAQWDANEARQSVDEYALFREDTLPAMPPWWSQPIESRSTDKDGVSLQGATSGRAKQLGVSLREANRHQGTASWSVERDQRIPKHMHFIWTGGQQELDRFEAELPPTNKRQHFNRWRQTCLDLHPEPAWRHMLWDLASMRALVRDDFPWMLPQYDAIDLDIKRTDLARLLILIRYGGVYVDIDFECLRPFDSDLIEQDDWQVILPEHRTNLPLDHRLRGRELPNAFMASVPRHPLFWVMAVEVLRRDRLNPGGYVTHITGPHVFSEIVFGFFEGFPGLTRVHILPIDVLFPVYCLDKDEMKKDAACVRDGNCREMYPKSLAVHHYAASWYQAVMEHMNGGATPN
jgi:hypothetical protein